MPSSAKQVTDYVFIYGNSEPPAAKTHAAGTLSNQTKHDSQFRYSSLRHYLFCMPIMDLIYSPKKFNSAERD